jgi:hypothetical protein
MAVNHQPAVALGIGPGGIKVAGGQRQLLHQGGVGHGEGQQRIKTEARRDWQIFNEIFTDESKALLLPRYKNHTIIHISN